MTAIASKPASDAGSRIVNGLLTDCRIVGQKRRKRGGEKWGEGSRVYHSWKRSCEGRRDGAQACKVAAMAGCELRSSERASELGLHKLGSEAA
jgi:hypothetical protein